MVSIAEFKDDLAPSFARLDAHSVARHGKCPFRDVYGSLVVLFLRGVGGLS